MGDNLIIIGHLYASFVVDKLGQTFTLLHPETFSLNAFLVFISFCKILSEY